MPRSTDNPPTKSYIGTNIRRLRTEAGLTQVELGERADVTDATLSRIERGRLVPSVELAGRIAEALEVTLDQLTAKPRKTAGTPSLRQCERKLLAVVRDLDDAQVDDVTRALRLMLGLSR